MAMCHKMIIFAILSFSMDQNQYIKFLISIGEDNALPNGDLIAANGFSTRVFLPSGWNTLQNEELISLFKGLVIIEEYWFSHDEHIGSTTDTKFVYREVLLRHLDDNYSLGDWAFQYSTNPYVPLDTGNRHGAKNIFELLSWESEFAERVRKEREDSVKSKEEKKRLKAEAHAERLRQKAIRDKQLGYKK